MRITKLGHACVRIETGDHVVVIDPGAFTAEADATDGATAILLTHEHPDHWTPEHLGRSDAPIHTIPAVADKIRETDPALAERVQVVRPGERFDVGAPVEVVGEKHAIIHDELPYFDNSGFLLDLDGTRVFHPGDALTVPEGPVDLLLLPVSAPWLKIAECIDYARAVAAPRSVGIHDEVYSETGHQVIGGHLQRFVAAHDGTYERVAAGSDIAT